MPAKRVPKKKPSSEVDQLRARAAKVLGISEEEAELRALRVLLATLPTLVLVGDGRDWALDRIEDAQPDHLEAGCNVLLHAMLERAGLAAGAHTVDVRATNAAAWAAKALANSRCAARRRVRRRISIRWA